MSIEKIEEKYEVDKYKVTCDKCNRLLSYKNQYSFDGRCYVFEGRNRAKYIMRKEGWHVLEGIVVCSKCWETNKDEKFEMNINLKKYFKRLRVPNNVNVSITLTFAQQEELIKNQQKVSKNDNVLNVSSIMQEGFNNGIDYVRNCLDRGLTPTFEED